MAQKMSIDQSPATAAMIERGVPSAHHWTMLAIAVLVIGATALLDVSPDGRVAAHALPDYPMPHLCMSRALLGVSCPGCGLTRSFIYLAHGHWQVAWQVHRLGWLLAMLVLAQVPYRGLILAGLIRPISSQAAQWLAMIVAGLLLVNWLLSLALSF
jgi:hypothetical protein